MYAIQLLLCVAAPAVVGAVAVPDVRAADDQLPTPTHQSLATLATPVPTATAACPAEFKNTVFNTDALQEPGNISHTWAELSSHGVSQFIAFTLYPMWNTSSYNATSNGKPSPKTPTVDAHQFRMIGGTDHVSDAIALITNPKTAPKYLELFNEPDFGNRLNPADAAKALEPLFQVVRAKKTNTVLVGSPVADSTGSWSQQFYEACNGCSALIPIQGVHSYDVNPDVALGNVAHVHHQFPNKTIWVTETSPSTIGNSTCQLNDTGVIQWMKKVIPALAETGYVEKVFWNRGTYKVRSNSPNNCDTSLVDADGNPRQLLLEYQKLC